MSALALSCSIFGLILGGILLGALLRRALPEHHLSKDSQDVVRLGVGLIATIAALVLGLLIAAAKSSFDTQSTQIKQITAISKFDAQTGEERVAVNVECASAVIGKVCEGWRKVAFATGLYDLQAQPKCACSRLLFSNVILARWNFWVDEHADHRGVRHQLVE